MWWFFANKNTAAILSQLPSVSQASLHSHYVAPQPVQRGLVLELHSSLSVERQMKTAGPQLCSRAPRLKLGLWQIDLIFGKWSAALSLASFASLPKANSGIVKI